MAADVLADRYLSRTILRMVEALDPASLPQGLDLAEAAEGLLNGLECANCGEPVEIASAHCSLFCHDMAKHVRYFRARLSEGRLNDSDIKQAMGDKLLSLFKGGYPAKERALTPEQREAIFERDQRTCQLCGAQADQIDHIAGDSADPSNLRAVCGPCNSRLAAAITGDASPDKLAEFREFVTEIYPEMATRTAVLQPLQCSDDHVGWRKLEAAVRGQRRRYFKEMAEDDENDLEDVDGYLAHSMQKDD